MNLTIPHGEGVDPCAAFLALVLPATFVTNEDHYAVTLPEGVSSADFIDALALDPAPIYLAAAKTEARAKVRDNARPAMMDAYPDVEPIVANRDALLALIDAATDTEALAAIDLTV